MSKQIPRQVIGVYCSYSSSCEFEIRQVFFRFSLKYYSIAMGALKLELRCPQNVHGVAVDPEPNWSFESLLSELNSLEGKLASSVPVPSTKSQSRDSLRNRKGNAERSSTAAFVVRVTNDDLEDSESEGEENHERSLVAAKRFSFDDIFISDSDDSEYEMGLDTQSYSMGETGVVEGALIEITRDYKLQVQEEIRDKISVLEAELLRESEKSASAFSRIEKYREARRELDRKLDTLYQRKIAEALDDHLTAIQRDHELKSQIEERKIRSDAAHEEAKRREKSLQEERLRQERAKAEAEMKRRSEEAKVAALEAERRAAEQAAEKKAAQDSAVASQTKDVGHQAKNGSSNLNLHSRVSTLNGTTKPQTSGGVVRAAESALILEQGRLHKLKELEDAHQTLRSSSNMDFSTIERPIARLIRQIRGTAENVRTKVTELVKILKDSPCPQSISVATFAKKVVSHCESPDDTAFACAHVTVLVAAQVPEAMDLLLAEFHRACIYTVPKHIAYSKSAFQSKEAYYRVIGHREEDGKIESKEDYLKRLESYMKLYGALVQTEIRGVQNSHGPKEGWAWLARFLNVLPANMYTAVALNAFLQTAGFALFRNYKSQFMKMLNIISSDFLHALRERQDSKLNPIITEIQSYISDGKFRQQPEGSILQEGKLLSSLMVPESGTNRAYYY